MLALFLHLVFVRQAGLQELQNVFSFVFIARKILIITEYENTYILSNALTVYINIFIALKGVGGVGRRTT